MCAARRRIAIALASCVVACVFCVSGFAQSNTGFRATVAVDRTAAGVLREYVAGVAAWPAELPPNLAAPSVYRSLLESMLQRSPTFRRQCVRLAQSPELAVTLQTGLPGSTYVRARTRIVRNAGQLIATIEVLRLEDPVELIAHEIEHIIEQLDGIDLPARAGVAASGVHSPAGDQSSFETARAVRVGLIVAAEMRRVGS